MNAIPDPVELTSVSPMAGSPEHVRHRLTHLKADQVVAVALRHATPQQADVIAQAFADVAHLVRLQFAGLDAQALESIVSALVPKVPPTPVLLKEVGMLARSRTAVLEGADWLTAPQIAKLAGFSESNPSAQPNKWKRDGAIFALRHHGIDYFPGYGLDPKTRYRPRKAMAVILRTFGEAKDSWGLAYWFMSVNSFLGGKRPQDVLTTRPERVIAAAEDELEGVAHG